jgi:hypothetical protein
MVLYKNEMTTLFKIETFLDIEIGDKTLKRGKKIADKNMYYYFEDQYYIVQLTRGNWMLVEDCMKTRKLLRLHCWHCKTNDYPRTSIDKMSKLWHQMFLNYGIGLVTDHINNQKFDNRFENLRIVTQAQNLKNLTKRISNTSGKQGVSMWTTPNNKKFWKAQITNNDGKRISKQFSVTDLGNDEAKNLAIEWRKCKETEYGYLGD